MGLKTPLLLTLFCSLAFTGCYKATPAGFWVHYKQQLLTQKIISQGPWGGHSALHWKSAGHGYFSSAEILHFSKMNGWTLVDSAYFTAKQTVRWMFENKPVFPLTNNGFVDSISNDAETRNFPRWFEGAVTVYGFTTGWETIEPATNKTTEENGFVVINQDRQEMAVYHLWGE